MTRILFYSDLHTEVRGFTPPDPDSLPARPDVLVLAGDTGAHDSAVAQAARLGVHFSCPVALVAGNHEFYNAHIELTEQRLRAEANQVAHTGADVRVLGGDGAVVTHVGPLRIIGATLWTDYDLYGAPAPAMNAARRMMNDHRLITCGADKRSFQPEDALDLHVRDRAAILAELARPHDGPTLVVSHHAPVRGATHPMYGTHPLNAAFASGLEHSLGEQAYDALIYGHTHNGLEPVLPRGQRVLTNARGYPGEATSFDPRRMIEL